MINKKIFIVILSIILIASLGILSANDLNNTETTKTTLTKDTTSSNPTIEKIKPYPENYDLKAKTKNITKTKLKYTKKATNVNVNNYNELINEINTAKNSNSDEYIINLKAGDYNATGNITWGNTTGTTRKLTINGNNITLDGQGKYQFMDILIRYNLNLNNLNLVKYNSTNNGAINNQGTLTITNSTLNNNNATSGGAINNYGTLTIRNCTLNNNTAYDFGGAIDNRGNLTLTNSTLNNNTAYLGGAIYNFGNMTLINSKLNNNSVGWSGGAIENWGGGNQIITNSTLNNNTADNSGGAIHTRGNLTLTNSTLNNNTAYLGGAIYNTRTLTITQSTLNNNTAQEGGAINNEGNLTIRNSTLNNNTGKNGGAIHHDKSLMNGSCFLYENEFINNTPLTWNFSQIDETSKLKIINNEGYIPENGIVKIYVDEEYDNEYVLSDNIINDYVLPQGIHTVKLVLTASGDDNFVDNSYFIEIKNPYTVSMNASNVTVNKGDVATVIIRFNKTIDNGIIKVYNDTSLITEQNITQNTSYALFDLDTYNYPYAMNILKINYEGTDYIINNTTSIITVKAPTTNNIHVINQTTSNTSLTAIVKGIAGFDSPSGILIVTNETGDIIGIGYLDSAGESLIKLDVKQPGTHEINVKYLGDNLYQENTAKIILNVTRQAIASVEILNNTVGNVTIKINVTTDNNTPITGEEVEITLPDGTIITKKTDENGTIIITDTTTPNTTTNITIKIPDSVENKGMNITVPLTINPNYQNIIDNLNNTVKEQNQTINQLTGNITELNNTVKTQNETINNLNNTVKTQNETINNLNNTVKDLNNINNNLNQTNKQINEQYENAKNTIKTLETEKQNLTNKLNTTTTELNNANNKINNLTKTNNDLSQQLDNTNKKLEDLAKTLENLNKQLADNQKTIDNLNKTIQDKDKTIKELTTKKNTKITVNKINETKYGDDAIIIGTLTDTAGTLLDNMPISIKINNIETKTVTDTKGTYTLNKSTTNIGTNNVIVSFAGNSHYNSVSTETTFNVVKQNLKISIEPIKSVRFKDNVTIMGVFTDANNKVIGNTALTISLNGKTYKVKTGKDGFFTYTTRVTSIGTANVTVSYAGNTKYNKVSSKATFKVTKQELVLTVDRVSSLIRYKDYMEISGKLVDGNDRPVMNTLVNIKINDKIYKAKTDKNGVYTLQFRAINMNTNNVTVSYAGNTKYKESTVKTTFTVAKQDIIIGFNTVKYANGKVTIIGTFTDRNRHALMNSLARITFNGKQGTAKTNNKGTFTYTTKANKGTYKITLAYPGNDRYNAYSKTSTVKTA
ncbi:MAG: hypothetical protein IJI98_09385 [Methanosphaera sp.]|nr:hypothetical protein [Methanosphaera sp.]